MRRMNQNKRSSARSFKSRASMTNGVNVQAPPRGGFRL